MVAHNIETLPDGSRDIVIPTLVPGEQITVSYLYFPPVVVGQVNAGIRCDQGGAHPIPVLLQRQFPAWLNRTTVALILVGLVTIFYLAYVGISAIVR